MQEKMYLECFDTSKEFNIIYPNKADMLLA